MLYYHYVLYKRLICRSIVAELLCQCLLNIVSRDFDWFNISWEGLSLTYEWQWLLKVLDFFRALVVDLNCINVLVAVMFIIINVVLELLDLLLKGVIVSWWNCSFSKDTVAANGEVIHSLWWRLWFTPTLTLPTKQKSRSLDNLTLIAWYILVFAVSFGIDFIF